MSSSIGGDLAGEVRLLLASMGRAAEAELRPGQRIAGRVIEMLSTDEALFDLGASRAVVRANGPLQPGARVVLEVVSGGPTPELRIASDRTASDRIPTDRAAADRPVTDRPVTDRTAIDLTATGKTAIDKVAVDKAAVTPQPAPAPSSPGVAANTPPTLTPRDLPVIMKALAEMVPPSSQPGSQTSGQTGSQTSSQTSETASQTGGSTGAPTAVQTAVPAGAPTAQAGHTFLQAAAAAGLSPAVVQQIQRLLAPLHAALPPAELAPALRAFLSQSGMFTENHIAKALQLRPGTPSPRSADQAQANTNANVNANASTDVDTDVRLLLGELTRAGTPVPDPVRAFGDALLQQQLVVAEQVAATSSGQMTIPVAFGDERVDIRFSWDRQAREEKHERAEPGDDQAISLGVFVNVHVFGAIEARIVWRPASFAVTFYVEREATRAIVDAGLSDLSTELSAAGLPAVTTNVWLNPDRVLAAAMPVTPTIPAGRILDVRA